MGGASLAALLYTGGDVRHIVVMYSINVFLTFSLSMLGMAREALRRPRGPAGGWRDTGLFVAALVLCATILVITVIEKLPEGGWITLAVTGSVVLSCLLVHRHYRAVAGVLSRLYSEVVDLPLVPESLPGPLDPTRPTAVLLVSAYGGLGIHTTLNIFRAFPGYYSNLVFLSVGVIDSGEFKGEGAIDELRARTEESLRRYVELARGLGLPATHRMALGTDAIEEAEKLCLEIAKEFPRSTFFAGKVVFQRERWYQRILHNETGLAVQQRLQWAGHTLVIPRRHVPTHP
jgi:hypothetical protein